MKEHFDAFSSFRMASGARGFMVVVLLSIALGIAANATVFSVVCGILLAPSVYKDVDQLVVLWESNNVKSIPRTAVDPATFRDWREAAHSFEDLVSLASCNTTLASRLM